MCVCMCACVYKYIYPPFSNPMQAKVYNCLPLTKSHYSKHTHAFTHTHTRTHWTKMCTITPTQPGC